jgi:hypothetical protein
MNLFINPGDERLRAGWRLLVQFVLMLIFSGLFVLIFDLIGLKFGRLFQVIGLLFGFTASTWVARKYLDRRTFTSLGLRFNSSWIRDYLFGIAAGCIVMGILFLVQLWSGLIEFAGYGWERPSDTGYLFGFLSYLIIMLFVGFYEELVFRGYQILNMVEGFTNDMISPKGAAIIAVILSSTIFGVMHAWNPNASMISTINIVIAGIVLALPFLNTGSLAIPVGLHTSWNFFQGGVFGFPVSGTVTRSSIFQVREIGPDFLTGGQFGPEAGITGLFGLILILGLYYLYFRHQRIPLKLHDCFKSN